jgi:hypothetical protein
VPTEQVGEMITRTAPKLGSIRPRTVEMATAMVASKSRTIIGSKGYFVPRLAARRIP